MSQLLRKGKCALWVASHSASPAKAVRPGHILQTPPIFDSPAFISPSNPKYPSGQVWTQEVFLSWNVCQHFAIAPVHKSTQPKIWRGSMDPNRCPLHIPGQMSCLNLQVFLYCKCELPKPVNAGKYPVRRRLRLIFCRTGSFETTDHRDLESTKSKVF